jgi:hypothetical protein
VYARAARAEVHATATIETAMRSADAQGHGLPSQGYEEWVLSEPRRAIHGPEDCRGSGAHPSGIAGLVGEEAGR